MRCACFWIRLEKRQRRLNCDSEGSPRITLAIKFDQEEFVARCYRIEVPMSAYVIVFVEEPADPAEIDRYRKLAIPTFQGRKAKFHVDPRCEIATLEGDPVDVVVMIEFDTLQEAKDWYYSPEYQNAVKHRL